MGWVIRAGRDFLVVALHPFVNLIFFFCLYSSDIYTNSVKKINLRALKMIYRTDSDLIEESHRIRRNSNLVI